jgi:hypothetical protein
VRLAHVLSTRGDHTLLKESLTGDASLVLLDHGRAHTNRAAVPSNSSIPPVMQSPFQTLPVESHRQVLGRSVYGFDAVICDSIFCRSLLCSESSEIIIELPLNNRIRICSISQRVRWRNWHQAYEP